MALLFCDSFDYYGTSEITQKWTTANRASISAENGTNGTSALFLSNAAFDDGFASISLSPSSASEGGVGFHLKLVSVSAYDRIVQFREGSTLHVSVGIDGSGFLVATRNGTVLDTGTNALSSDTYYHIEVKAVIHNSTGSVVVRLNGVEELSFSGDTQNGGTGTWTNILFYTNGPDLYLDNVVIWDTSGTTNNDFLGPIRVIALLPDGAGASSDFTPSAGSNYENVDETSTDGDTTYVSATNAGDHDTYTFGDLAVNGTVKAVQTNLIVRSDAAGAETIAPVIRIGSTDYTGTTVGVTITYADSREIFETSPATGAAWTPAEINGAEFGIKLVS